VLTLGVKGDFVMRKTIALVLAAAFVAALPSMASAAKKRHHKRQAVAAQVGERSFVYEALHQILK
jgi:hypothetical protein